MDEGLANIHAKVTVVRASAMTAKTIFKQISEKVLRLPVVSRR